MRLLPLRSLATLCAFAAPSSPLRLRAHAGEPDPAGRPSGALSSTPRSSGGIWWARRRSGAGASDTAAAQARAEILVTGDRAHFGALFGKRLRGVEVLPPVDALARLLR